MEMRRINNEAGVQHSELFFGGFEKFQIISKFSDSDLWTYGWAKEISNHL